MRAALDPEDLAKYSIVGREEDFEKLGSKVPSSGLVSLQSKGKDKSKSESKMYKKDKKRQKQQNGFGDRKGGHKKKKI